MAERTGTTTLAERHRTALVSGAVLVAALAASQLLSLLGDTGRAIPGGVIAKGAVHGLTQSLFVVGLVLIYRAARVINFGHTGFGFIAVMLYLLLRVVWDWPFALAVAAVLAGAAALGGLVEIVVVRRFATAPRLVLTVVTVALGLFLVGFALLLPDIFGLDTGADNSTGTPTLPSAAPELPGSGLSWQWGFEVFGSAHLIAVSTVVVVLGALAVFLRRSTTGVAIRGAAENRRRAALLGVRVNDLSTVVWALAAVLAAIGFVLQAMLDETGLTTTVGIAGGAAFSGGIFVRALGAAVIARMENLPIAVSASLAIALVDQAVFWGFRNSAAVDAALLVLIVGALLVQRRRLSRSDPGSDGTWEAATELQPIPSALTGLEVVRRTRSRFLVLVAGVVLAYPWVMSPSQTLEGSLYAIQGIIVVSLVVLTGWGGQISLGQFGFVAVGALIGGWLSAGVGLPFALAALGAAVAGGLAAVLVGLPALRVQGQFLAVTSLAFAVVAQSVLLDDRWFGGVVAERVTRPVFFGIDMNTADGERAFYYLCVAGLVLAVFMATSLRRTRTGRILIALRDNARSAQSFGVNLTRTRLITFAIAGGLAGFAGVLYANHQFGVAQSSFGPQQSLTIFLMAVMGGLGSVHGVLLGVVYFGLINLFFEALGGGDGGAGATEAGLALMASSLGVLIVLVSYPGGLGALAYRARDAWLRRIAQRYRIFVPSLLGVDRRSEGEDDALVPLADRADDREEVPRQFTLDSEIGDAGRSQRRGALL